MATVSISAPHAPTYKIPSQYQATVDRFNSTQGITPTSSKSLRNASPSSSPAKQTATPSPATPQPVTTVSNVVKNPNSYPSFFSWEGQKLALNRVVSVLNPFDRDKLNWTNPFTGQAVAPATGVKTVTRVAEVGALSYGGALAYSAAGGGGTLATATNIGTGATRVAPLASNSLRNLAIAGAAGLGAGALLFRGGSQTTNPQQTQGLTNVPTQDTQQNPIIAPQQGGAGGFTQTGQGNSLRYRQSQDTFTTYNAQASPYQSTPIDQTAGQETSPSQGDTGSLLIPALIVAAALVVSR